MSKSVVLKPRMSEKAYMLNQSQNSYVFLTDKGLSSVAIKRAVESQYGVRVTAVRVANIKGKIKKSYKKRGGRTIGKDMDVKKVYISLAEGEKLPVFEAVEAELKAEAEADAKAKKETK